MAATAVLSGALIVGDSVRASLRRLVLERLGKIDEVLVMPRFFRQQLAGELAAAPQFQDHFTAAMPAILLQGTLENSTSGQPHRAGEVTVLGVGPEFWQMGSGGPKTPPGADEIVLNEPLAARLQAKVGDEIILRLPQAADVPADSPLGRKTETTRSSRFKVSAIIAAEGLGRFGIRPNQQLPLNAFTAIEPLAHMVEADGRANAILVAGKTAADTPSDQADRLLQIAVKPKLEDYGLSLHKTDFDYFNLTSDRMLLEPAVAAAAMKAFADHDPQPVFTYLANYITAGEGRAKIPYSTAAAVDFVGQPAVGRLLNRLGEPIEPLSDDEIVLNSWAADDLAAEGVPVKTGDTIELTYFQPESTHGEVVERHHEFRLKDIVPLAGHADDRNFTPEVKGVTDEASIANWNPPFPYDKNRVRTTPPNDQDDRYWREHRAVPKAFVGLNQGRRLWGSRFGNTTSIRIPAGPSDTEQSLAARLLEQIDPAALGLVFLPVKRMGLAAAQGTTPFALLFLGFSIFIIAAALLLVMLLFKLSIDQRARELGIVLALGARHRLVRRLLLIEGMFVSVAGAAVGVAAGIAFAWLLIVGLESWWLGAITTPFLQLEISAGGLVIGFAFGILASLLTIAWAVRQTRQASVRSLLAGQTIALPSLIKRRTRLAPWISVALAACAIAIDWFATRWDGEARAAAFVGGGMLLLGAILTWIWDTLRAEHGSFVNHKAPLARFAWRNGGRHPLRSTLTIGLTAAAAFLIVALSAFRLDPPDRAPQINSGDGGFALMAQSDQPIYQDLNSPEARQELGFDDKAESRLAARMAPTGRSGGAEIIALRLHSGDDASCLNLYQPRQPRIIGVPENFIHRGGFAWGPTIAETREEQKNPWLGLRPESRALRPDVIPCVLDQNTALYSLHLRGTLGEEFQINGPQDEKINLRVVGLLENSIFQGAILMSETDFLRLFPDDNGYRMFLIATTPDRTAAVADALDQALGDYGFTSQTTADRLASFFAVQNAYLATFQSLGGLGLLLGTLGLAAVQLRGIVERRGELALLRATGFRRRRLAQLVMLENAWLLIAGLGCGTIAALVAILPHFFGGGASVPWLALAGTLSIVLVVGLAAGLLAVRAALRAPLLDTLRAE
jgi:putative ABC transport system permease protein